MLFCGPFLLYQIQYVPHTFLRYTRSLSVLVRVFTQVSFETDQFASCQILSYYSVLEAKMVACELKLPD